MEGYINDTLSTAFMSHDAISQDFIEDQMKLDNGFNFTSCRSVDPVFSFVRCWIHVIFSSYFTQWTKKVIVNNYCIITLFFYYFWKNAKKFFLQELDFSVSET